MEASVSVGSISFMPFKLPTEYDLRVEKEEVCSRKPPFADSDIYPIELYYMALGLDIYADLSVNVSYGPGDASVEQFTVLNAPVNGFFRNYQYADLYTALINSFSPEFEAYFVAQVESYEATNTQKKIEQLKKIQSLLQNPPPEANMNPNADRPKVELYFMALGLDVQADGSVGVSYQRGDSSIGNAEALKTPIADFFVNYNYTTLFDALKSSFSPNFRTYFDEKVGPYGAVNTRRKIEQLKMIEAMLMSASPDFCAEAKITAITPTTLVADDTEQKITLHGQHLEKVAFIGLFKVGSNQFLATVRPNTNRTEVIESLDISLTVPFISDYQPSDQYRLVFKDAEGRDIGSGMNITITQPQPTAAERVPPWVTNLQGQNTKLEVGAGYIPVADHKGGGAMGQASFRWKPAFSYVGDDADENFGISPELYADYLYLYDKDYTWKEYLWLRAGFAPTFSTAFNSNRNRFKLEVTPAYEFLAQGKNRYDHILRVDAALPISIVPDTWKASPLFRYQYNNEIEDYRYSEAVFGPDFEGERHRVEVGGETKITGSTVSFTGGVTALVYSTYEVPDSASGSIENVPQKSSGFHVYGVFDFDFPISSVGGMYNQLREGTEITKHWMARLGLVHNILVLSVGQLEGSLPNPFELGEINPFLTDYHYPPRLDDRKIAFFIQPTLAFKELKRAPAGMRAIKVGGLIEMNDSVRVDNWGISGAYNFAELWADEEE